MSARKRTALIICPGRGVYNADELGYFSHHHPDKTELMACFDTQRQAAGQVPVSELDSANRFSASTFTRGDNASALIYACSVADFLSIDRNTFEIVAVTGNSMGWYTALACAGALSVGNGFRTVNTMGTIMQEQLIGGQLIYPLTDGDWQERPQAGKQVMELVAATDGLYVSIRLGGIIVLAGTNEALRVAEAELPNVSERFPLRLPNHAAFHSPLLKPNSESAQKALSPSM
ncbi:MAG: ACP S-malonyltransferase, partial [Hyphomonadaceae bacterium]|nr:ACP S-malonyltransferase [Hyphomonadaceae bacterium]